jgi:hypothetical protein
MVVMASRKNKEHKLRMKKRGEHMTKKILKSMKAKSSKGVLHAWKAKPYKAKITTKRRYNRSKK